MERLIDEIFPIMDVERDMIVSKAGDVTIGYQAELPEVFTLSNEHYEAFHHTWVKAIKILPANTVFHKQDWFIEDSYAADFLAKGKSFLSHSSERYFNERRFLNHRCNIFLTKKPANRKLANSIYSNLLKKSIVPEETVNSNLLLDFADRCGQFCKILEESGFVRLAKLTDKQICSDDKHVGLIEAYLTLSNKCIVADVSFDNGITIGDKCLQVFTLTDSSSFPNFCGSRMNFDKYSTDKTKFSIGFSSSLGLLLSCNHIFNQYLFIGNAQSTIKKFESKRLRLQSLSAYSRENALGKEATNDFLNEAIAEQRTPVKVHFNVIGWTDTTEERKELKNLITAAFAQMDAIPKIETVGAPQIYWAGIPGNQADFPMNDTFDTFAEQACCFFNLETNYRSSVSPFGLRLGDRLTGVPIHVDISDEPMAKGICRNRNKFILGPSGSGKSFFTNHMVRSYYEQGTHIVMIDVGHSYRTLCIALNGYYFTYDEKNPICFNPFYIGRSDILDTEKKESIKTLLLALWKKDNESFNRSEYVALSSALQLYYDHLANHKDIFPCFNSFYEFLQNHFTEVLIKDQVKEKDFDFANFLYVLRPYYRGGEFDYLLNATESLELLDERFIVFELDNIKDHPILFPVVTIIIMEVFISKMRKLKGIRKMILIEEAWKAIAREGMAEYIKYLFKTVRKFFGEAVVVTQEVEDIISSTIIKQAIINNSDCKILLDQSKYQNKFEQIQELLGLSEKDKTLVLSINKANDVKHRYKEIFISLGGTLSKVYRFEVSPEEYYTYTTEEREKLKVYESAAQFNGDVQMGISALVREANQ
jgi:conjugation system TraG family ATPase